MPVRITPGSDLHDRDLATPCLLDPFLAFGHFIFRDDPDLDDSCGSKRVGGVYVEMDEDVYSTRFNEALAEAREDFGAAIGKAYS